MESIKDKVAIVGMGCTRFGERWDMGVGDLLVEAAYEAFEDAGIGPKDIQAAWLGTVFSGVSAMAMSGLGLQYVPITRVEKGAPPPIPGAEASETIEEKLNQGARDSDGIFDTVVTDRTHPSTPNPSTSARPRSVVGCTRHRGRPAVLPRLEVGQAGAAPLDQRRDVVHPEQAR